MPPEFLWAKHILTNPQARWDLMSSFHKSLRSGIIGLAMNWGRIFVLKMGEKTVRSYLKRIIFEETRNLTLYSMMLEDRPIFELISAFTRSKKKWQLSYYRDHFWQWNQGYKDFYDLINSDRELSFEALLNPEISKLSGSKIYLTNYILQDFKKRDTELLKFIKHSCHNEMILKYIDSKDNDYGSMYYRMVLLELLNGNWQDEANQFSKDTGEPPFYVPKRLLWYFDIHTRAKKLIQGRYDTLRPGREYAAHDLDLRMSGQVIGVGYRFSVSDPLDSDFTQVNWSDYQWEILKLHERKFYQI